ncbi:hypothetical protein ACFL34_04285 [Candidatus Sumerlaeota bacterium]
MRDVDVVRRTASGRVKALKITGEKRSITFTSDMTIRKMLNGVYSTLIVIDKERDRQGNLKSVTVSGAGFGHGVGLCQMGASVMARRGYSHRAILRHYFSKIEFRQLY